VLVDLEELLLQVRGESSRFYLREAVRSYGVGAYRAAVLSTWIAVSYDLTEKFRELAAANDKAAIPVVADLDKWIACHDTRQMQAFESGLIKLAQETFQFFSEREALDLKRLYEDRHFCAHPAFASPRELYSPSAELARTHMVNAVRIVLSQEPRHGRAALEELREAIVRSSFPQDPSKVDAFMATFLGRARPTLVGQTLAVCLKFLLLRIDPALEPHQRLLAIIIKVILNRFPAECEGRIRELLPSMLSNADDQAVWRLYWLLAEDSRFWGWAGSQVRIRLAELTKKWKFKTAIPPFRIALGLPELREAARYAYDHTDKDAQFILFEACPDPMFFESSIEIFADSANFRTAEARCASLLPRLAASPGLTADHVLAVLRAADDNRQIWDAAATPDLLAEFFQATRALMTSETADAWRAYLGGRGATDATRRRHWRYGALLSAMVTAGIWTEVDASAAELEPDTR